jgi:hypothetical protein
MNTIDKINNEDLIGFGAKVLIALAYPQRLEHKIEFDDQGRLIRIGFSVTNAEGLTRHTTDWPTAVEWYNEESSAARGEE